MIKEIILNIESERVRQGISETALAKRCGVDQNKVWRFLNGKTKRPDVELIEKIQLELGITPAQYPQIVSEPEQTYSSEIKELIRITGENPLIKIILPLMADLPEKEQFKFYEEIKAARGNREKIEALAKPPHPED